MIVAYNFKAWLFLQLIRKKMVKSAKECMKMKASKSEIYGRIQTVFIEMETCSPQVNNGLSYFYGMTH